MTSNAIIRRCEGFFTLLNRNIDNLNYPSLLKKAFQYECYFLINQIVNNIKRRDYNPISERELLEQNLKDLINQYIYLEKLNCLNDTSWHTLIGNNLQENDDYENGFFKSFSDTIQDTLNFNNKLPISYKSFGFTFIKPNDIKMYLFNDLLGLKTNYLQDSDISDSNNKTIVEINENDFELTDNQRKILCQKNFKTILEFAKHDGIYELIKEPRFNSKISKSIANSHEIASYYLLKNIEVDIKVISTTLKNDENDITKNFERKNIYYLLLKDEDYKIAFEYFISKNKLKRHPDFQQHYKSVAALL